MTGYTENDLLRSRGVYPAVGMESIRAYNRIPDNATQVVETGATSADGIVMYTVEAGKILYLSQAVVIVRNKADSLVNVYCRIRSVGDDTIYLLTTDTIPANTSTNRSYSWPIPFELPEGCYFYIGTTDGDCAMFVSLHGYKM